MSEADAERIRRAYEVWNESGPAAVTDQFWAEDAVYREGPGWPDAGVYRGRAAALERMQSLIELVGPIEVRLEELIDVGDGRFIACTSMVGEGASRALHAVLRRPAPPARRPHRRSRLLPRPRPSPRSRRAVGVAGLGPARRRLPAAFLGQLLDPCVDLGCRLLQPLHL